MMRRRGPGLARGIARTAVVAGTASVVAGSVHHHQQQKWANQEQQQAAEQQAIYDQGQADAMGAQPQPAAVAAQAAPAEPDYMAELQQLAQLKAQGIITEEEFEAKKKKLLGI